MPRPAAAPLAFAAARPGRVVGVELDDLAWFGTIRRRVPPGTTSDEPLSIPVGVANKLLHAIVRFVADIPAGSPPEVVWTQGSDELLVDTSSIAMQCTSGLVQVRFAVDCDQLDERSQVTVPLAVGTPKQPTGLVMSTFRRVQGPAVVVDVWSDAIAAFAWESVVELARRLCAEVGKDQRGRPLIPADIAASRNRLLITPMARHDVTLRGL